MAVYEPKYVLHEGQMRHNVGTNSWHLGHGRSSAVGDGAGAASKLRWLGW